MIREIKGSEFAMRIQISLAVVMAGIAMAQEPGRKGIQIQMFQAGNGAGATWVSDVAFAPPQSRQFFFASEGFGGMVVKGAPYSGEGVTEFTQTLGDGTRINRRSSTVLARDGEGRTRQEHMLGNDGPRMITIHDPVTEISYSLNDKDKTAHKMKPLPIKVDDGERGIETAKILRMKEKVAAEVSEDVVFERRVAVSGTAGAMARPVPMVAGIGGQMRVFRTAGDAKSESLGTQMIEGLLCEGTRISHTIPAGEIGNDRPLTTVTERWYSKELRAVILSRSNDPMSGETVYRLTNVRRSEPDRRLFEVPADYTLVEGPTEGVHILHREKK
jgi:hypothetical protein